MANWIFMYCTHFCFLWSQLPCRKRKTSNTLSKDLNWDIKETFWCIVWSALFSVSCMRCSSSLSCNYPISSLSPEPTFFYSFVYLFYLPQQTFVSLVFLYASTFLPAPHPASLSCGCSHQGSGLSSSSSNHSAKSREGQRQRERQHRQRNQKEAT